ncbi:hypothetical protein Cgig2_017511 [Carnegiea gigantea]|uniref:Uncharacterized protein n=1 Tax=Carnegiea gigantea TaxID=171969 RepID=A0A9Q1K3G2_9CARY|nr:hypothetical protein Cgig2_017511 [Carnegiea gigantea]
MEAIALKHYQDVYATLALRTSSLEVQVAVTYEPTNEQSKLLNQRGTRSTNGNCFFRILKLLMDVNQIAGYNLRAHFLQCLNETVAPWKQNPNRCCRGPPLFHRWFPTAIHLTGDAIEQRNEDKKDFPGERGRGNTIANEIGMHGIRKPTYGSSPAAEQLCPKCGSATEPPIARPNHPIEVHVEWISKCISKSTAAIAASGERFSTQQVTSYIEHRNTNLQESPNEAEVDAWT